MRDKLIQDATKWCFQNDIKCTFKTLKDDLYSKDIIVGGRKKKVALPKVKIVLWANGRILKQGEEVLTQDEAFEKVEEIYIHMYNKRAS